MKFGLSNNSSDVSVGSVGRRDDLTFRGNVPRGRHGWLRLTPAYSLHVVDTLLDSANKAELVLDPFSGTGTTALAAAARGIRCHALDINPFLVWLGNLKVSHFDSTVQGSLPALARRVVADMPRLTEQANWTPDLHSIEKWWSPDVLRSLSELYAAINSAAGDDACHDLLRIAFSKVLIGTANVSFGHQSMSFKKRERESVKQLSFLSLDPIDAVRAGFIDTAVDIAESLATDQPLAEAIVFLGDSRDPKQGLPATGYANVITSPPYPNRMSYIRELRPYMYWLGYLTDGRQAGELDWEAIGGTWGCATSLLNTWQPDGVSIPHPSFEKIVDEIGAGHHLLGRYVHKYFEDTHRHINSLKLVLVPGAKCHYVVGNSKFYNTLLPTEEIYAAIFEAAGFSQVRIQTLRKRTSKKELYEFIVHAEASGKFPIESSPPAL